MTSATFAPPPDGVVDAADLAFLQGQDAGPVSCDDLDDFSGGGELYFEGTYLGLLLEELAATGNEELIPDILALLEEWMD